MAGGRGMNDSYRIFHLIKGLGRGGAEVLLQDGLLHRDSYKFTYGYGYFLPWKDALVPSLRESGAEVVCFEKRNFAEMLLSVRRVADFLREWRADLLHCHLPLAGVIGRLAAKRLKIPVVYTEHNLMERYHTGTRWANLYTWKMQSAVVAVSHQVKNSIQARTGNSVPVSVIENGIAIENFQRSTVERENIRYRYEIPSGAVVIGTVAVFRIQKNLKDWLSAARLISDKRSDVYFLLVGDGPLKKEMQDYASMLRLNNVRFAGLQQNVNAFYSAMDIYLSSSIFEGLPLALLEAMAMHLPVVATSVGGVPDVVESETSGFLVPPHSVEALVEKLQLLLEDQKLRTQFGAAGRRVVETRFQMKRMVRELEALYLRILEKPALAI
jgi:glycosyltransferase involved in cell wall biosynthesis